MTLSNINNMPNGIRSKSIFRTIVCILILSNVYYNKDIFVIIKENNIIYLTSNSCKYFIVFIYYKLNYI